LAQVGGFFGCFVNAWSADRLGRVKSFQIAAAFCIVGAAIQSAAVNVPMLLVFRFINGLGVGMLLVIVPMYQSELSPPHARGFLVGQHGLFLAIGYNLAAWTGFGCFWAKNGDFAWRFPLAAQVIFPIILLAGSFWMPQSPRWLITQERNEEACTIIKRLHRSPDDPGDTFATAEYNQMVAQIQFESIKRNGSFGFISSAKLLMQKPSYRKRAFLGFGIMFGAQCTGVLVINNYQVTLFPGLGVSPAMSLALYCIYLFIALIGNGTCGFIVDRLGRRKMLLIGLVGSCFALVGETIFASLSEHTNNRAILGLAVFFIFAYIPFFSTFVDTTQYIYMSEIFPSEVRSHGVALSVSGQSLLHA
jgi:sugar porter (SP) family MFS transporter